MKWIILTFSALTILLVASLPVRAETPVTVRLVITAVEKRAVEPTRVGDRKFYEQRE